MEMMGQIRFLQVLMESCRTTHTSFSLHARSYFYEHRGWVEYRLIVLIAETSTDLARAHYHCFYLAVYLYYHMVVRLVMA